MKYDRNNFHFFIRQPGKRRGNKNGDHHANCAMITLIFPFGFADTFFLRRIINFLSLSYYYAVSRSVRTTAVVQEVKNP